MKIKYNKKNISTSIVIGILCVVLTFGMVVQIRTVKSNISISNPDYANNSLRDEVLKNKEKYDNAFIELSKINKELEKYRKKATNNDSTAKEKQESKEEKKEKEKAVKVAQKKFKELGEKAKKEELEVLKIKRKGEYYYYISAKDNTVEIRITDNKITRVNSVPVE